MAASQLTRIGLGGELFPFSNSKIRFSVDCLTQKCFSEDSEVFKKVMDSIEMPCEVSYKL